MQFYMYFEIADNDTFAAGEVKESIKHPYIIHYTGSCKPWNYHNTHSLRKE